MLEAAGGFWETDQTPLTLVLHAITLTSSDPSHKLLFVRPQMSSCPLTDVPPKSNVVETSECYEGRGSGYRGTVDVTPTGLACQRWDSQYPHNHTFTPQAYSCK